MTFEFEKLLCKASEDGISFTEGQKAYFEAVRLNSVSIIDSIYNAYVLDLAGCTDKEKEAETFKHLEWLTDIREIFDDNLCKIINQAIEMQRAGV